MIPEHEESFKLKGFFTFLVLISSQIIFLQRCAWLLCKGNHSGGFFLPLMLDSNYVHWEFSLSFCAFHFLLTKLMAISWLNSTLVTDLPEIFRGWSWLVLCESKGEFNIGYFKERLIIYIFRRIAVTLAGPKIPWTRYSTVTWARGFFNILLNIILFIFF